MPTKHLTGSYPGGYTLAPGYTELIINETAFVGGDGVTVDFSATVANRGTIEATGSTGQGVYLMAGGSFINGSKTVTSALAAGYAGVKAGGAAAITNYGTIEATGSYSDGVILNAGGSLDNGSTSNSTALITGYYGVAAAGAVIIRNFGRIEGKSCGVLLSNGGEVINGSAANTGGSISGVTIEHAAATVTNFGTIAGTAASRAGVYINYGGKVTNGAATDTTAVISGASYGIFASENFILNNFGTIKSSSVNGAGVADFGIGKITNGTATDTKALISGYNGCYIGYHTTLVNNGTIRGSSRGVELSPGMPSLINGSEEDTTALITGRVGLYSNASDVSRALNFGTIHGSDVGVSLQTDVRMTNGSTTDRKSLIVGDIGFFAHGDPNLGYATLDNFGTVRGTGGVAVEMTGARDELIAEAGSTFIGSISGGGGRLALAGGGAGAISGLGGAGTLSGAVHVDFSGFGSYEIAAGGTWTLEGSNALTTASVLVDEGTLINRGALSISGTISIAASAVFRLASGDIAAGPTGTASIVDYGLMIKEPGTGKIAVGAHMFDRGVVEVASGDLDFTSHLFGTGVLRIDGGATLEADAAAVSTLTTTFNGATATLALMTPKAFDATLSGFAAGDIIDLLAVTATGASVNGSDQLVVVNGKATVATLQLAGSYVGTTFNIGSDGKGGTDVTIAGGANIPQARSTQLMVMAMAGMASPSGLLWATHDPIVVHSRMLAGPRTQLA